MIKYLEKLKMLDYWILSKVEQEYYNLKIKICRYWEVLI